MSLNCERHSAYFIFQHLWFVQFKEQQKSLESLVSRERVMYLFHIVSFEIFRGLRRLEVLSWPLDQQI